MHFSDNASCLMEKFNPLLDLFSSHKLIPKSLSDCNRSTFEPNQPSRAAALLQDLMVTEGMNQG